MIHPEIHPAIHPAKIFFSQAHPLFSIFKVEFIETSPKFLAMKFVAQKEFVDREETGRLHSGFCTLILDSVMGGSVMGSLEKIQPIATVNLTTQHSHRALLDDAILCSARVERIEDQVAVVTGRVTNFEKHELLASAIGSFMIGTRATPLAKKTGSNR
jgi:acyl-coenzyme A thioesterase PaaI-like protein